MKDYETDKIRNIALVGNKGVGKTSLLDCMIFHAGLNNRIGKVDDGTSFVDYDQMEIKRKQTITAKVIPIEWKNFKINVFDTPGYADFLGEAISAIAVSDIVIIVIDAEAGVEIPTKRLFNLAAELKKPMAFLINSMDAERANPDRCLSSIKEGLGTKAVFFEHPIGISAGFKGVVDLLQVKAYITEGGSPKEGPIPDDIKDTVSKLRTDIIEAVAENDETLLEKYLGGGEITEAELKAGLVKGMASGDIRPVFIASGAKDIGVVEFMDMVVRWLPSPQQVGIPCSPGSDKEGEIAVRKVDKAEPFSALVFKATSDPGIGDVFFFRVYSGVVTHGDDVYNVQKRTTERMGHLFVMRGSKREEVTRVYAGDIAAVAKLKSTSVCDSLALRNNPVSYDFIKFPEPMVSLAVQPKTKQDQDKLGGAFSKLMAIDPTFKMHMDTEFNETIISGLGEVHLEVMLERLNERFGIAIDVGKPRVPYRETIRKTVRVQGKYKKQSGGRGQYGDCWIEVSPLPPGKGFEFVDNIVGGAIPSRYIPAVEKGIRESMKKGVLAGYPVVDVKVSVYDGSYHEVDSSDLAFQIAGSMAFKKAEEEASPLLLEPIMNVEVTLPSEYMGDVSSDISSRRGRVVGVEHIGDVCIIKAQVPLAELYKYSTTIRSITSGAGSHSMSYSHYEQVPSHIAQKVIEEAKRAKEEKS